MSLITLVDLGFVAAGLGWVVRGFLKSPSPIRPAPPLRPAALVATVFALAVAAIGPNILVVALTPGMPEMPVLARWALAPSLVVFALVALAARGAGWDDLSNRLWAGAWWGAWATAALDAVRLTGFSLGFMPGNMPRMFGVLIFDTMAVGPSVTSDLVGYLYHYWVGACFGLTYTLLVGRTRWWGPLIWALIIEVGMMVTPPMVVAMDTGYFGSKSGPGLFLVSLTAHVAYGIVLGKLLERHLSATGHLPGRILRFLRPAPAAGIS